MIPVGDKILVKPDQTERKTAGGIIIPDAVADRQRSNTGIITAVSVSAERMGFKTGQRAWYRGGKPVEVDGVPHVVLNVDENSEELQAVQDEA